MSHDELITQVCEFQCAASLAGHEKAAAIYWETARPAPGMVPNTSQPLS